MTELFSVISKTFRLWSKNVRKKTALAYVTYLCCSCTFTFKGSGVLYVLEESENVELVD